MFFLKIFLLSLLQTANSSGNINIINTSRWIGAEYTPARATNQLWWWQFDLYIADIHRELGAAQKHYGYTVLRMFLHTMLYDADSQGLIKNMTSFMNIANIYGFKVGFVFFDDCWSHHGANLSSFCLASTNTSKNGCELGTLGQSKCCMNCWFASPQDNARDSVHRYEPYISNIVHHFREDDRILWWEIFNEPQNKNYSMTLRDMGYRWAKAALPLQPVLSCWSDNNDTDAIDFHTYTGKFKDMTTQIYSNPKKGAFVTESGCRWYRTYKHDAGSPLNVINWLHTLTSLRDNGTIAFVPGALLVWELMVGNVNTRFQWQDPAGTSEPPIPWCGSLFPDGTPVSYTEAAMVRQYLSKFDKHGNKSKLMSSDFIFVDTFLSQNTILQDDQWFGLTAKQPTYISSTMHTFSDGLIEVSLWPTNKKVITTVLVRAVNTKISFSVESSSYYNISITSGIIHVSQKRKGQSLTLLDTIAINKRGGFFLHAWNLLRVILKGNNLCVWFNPQYPDTQKLVLQNNRNIFENKITASSHSTHWIQNYEVVSLAPLLNITIEKTSLMPPGILQVHGTGPGRSGDDVIVALDYLSVLPVDVL